MKRMKKLTSLLLVLVMVFALSATAYAQDVNSSQGGSATITISNASKGETYKVYKLFDASVTGTTGGSIAYTGDIPTSLNSYFSKDSAGNISVVESVNEAELFAALKTWTETATPVIANGTVSDGSTLKITGLQYGYYVVTSTQGTSAITVTSTNPTAEIVDKNSTTPGPDGTTPVKSSNADAPEGSTAKDVNIGDTVTYTIQFKTTNFNGAGADAKRIVSYTITDTLPDFLGDVNVTSITIDGTDYKVNDATPQFDETNKNIIIPWVSGDATNGYTSLYKNGAVVKITYTATVTDDAAIDGEGNKNEVTISWNDTDGPVTGEGSTITGSETIYTYAIAIQKVDQNGNPLANATFELPFYVKETADTDDAYIYAGTTAGTGLTNTLTTPNTGLIIVKGVEAGTYNITETVAPKGYNKLTTPESVTATKTDATTTSTTIYLDKDGNKVDTQQDTGHTVTVSIENLAATAQVVVNKTGSELPTTGGTGTTVLYVIGCILVLGAGVLLVVRRRMSASR